MRGAVVEAVSLAWADPAGPPGVGVARPVWTGPKPPDSPLAAGPHGC